MQLRLFGAWALVSALAAGFVTPAASGQAWAAHELSSQASVSSTPVRLPAPLEGDIDPSLPFCEDVPENTPCQGSTPTPLLENGGLPPRFCDQDFGRDPNGEPIRPLECTGEAINPDGVNCDARPMPWECTAGPGAARPGEEESGIPPFAITPAQSGQATRFHFEDGLATIGLLAFSNIVYMDYGDGGLFGGNSDLRRPISLPRSHVYEKAGTYTMRLHVYVVEDEVENYYSSAVTFTVEGAPTTTSAQTNATRVTAVSLTNKELLDEATLGPTSPNRASDPAEITQVNPAGIFDTVGAAASAIVSSVRSLFAGFFSN